MKQQERKIARRQRRSKRRKERDSLLISNAFLRESVAQYERSIKIAEAVAATQKRIKNGGRASDEEEEEDDHSNGSSNESEYSGEDEAMYNNTEEKETQDTTKESNTNNSNDLNDLNDLNDSNDKTTPLSRPGTADENGALVTITETKRVSNVDEGTLNGMASLGMALQPANAKVGDPFKYDSDQDSDEFEDTNESTNETKSQNQNKKRNGKNSSSSSKKSREKKMLLSNWGFAPPGGTDIFDEMMGSGDGLLIEDDGELKRKMHMDALSVPVIPDAPATRRNNTESKNNENGKYSKRKRACIA